MLLRPQLCPCRMAGLTMSCLEGETSFGSVSAEHLHVQSNCSPAAEFSYFLCKAGDPSSAANSSRIATHPGISREPVFLWKCLDVFETQWLFRFSNDQQSRF